MSRLQYILLALLLSFPFAGAGQNQSIVFTEKPFAELLTLARSGNKLIFLDAYTTWCGPCKWMAANMFTNDTVAGYFNKMFICAHFDMEKGEGIELAKKYQVRAYPTLLFINGNGEMVHSRVGAPRKASDYLEMGHEALTPGEGLAACMKEYQGGNRNPVFLARYFDRLEKAYLPVTSPVNLYLESLSDNDLLKRENWNLINRHVNDMGSRGFTFLLSHQEEYSKRYTVDSVNTKIFNVYFQALNAAGRNRSFNETAYNELKQKIGNSGFRDAGKVLFISDLNILQMKGETDKFIALAMDGTEKYYSQDADMLNRMAWSFFQMASDVKSLEMAARWSMKSIALKDIPENNDTYANLMFKLGKKEEAIRFGLKAVEQAKQNNLPVKEYEESLKKFEGK